MCKQRGIPTSGSKGEIVERILAAPAATMSDMVVDKPEAVVNILLFFFYNQTTGELTLIPVGILYY